MGSEYMKSNIDKKLKVSESSSKEKFTKLKSFEKNPQKDHSSENKILDKDEQKNVLTKKDKFVKETQLISSKTDKERKDVLVHSFKEGHNSEMSNLNMKEMSKLYEFSDKEILSCKESSS